MSTARNSFKTTKGTELPILNLKGKEYLEVKYRLLWFREDHPDWSIETELIKFDENFGFSKATIRDEGGRIIATSHKLETIQGFPDFIEKSETGAIGRALALIGYGTQFCADALDEGARIVDSPVEKKTAPPAKSFAPNVTNISSKPKENYHGGDDDFSGEFIIEFGRKYKGKKLKEIPKNELESYLEWLEGSAAKAGTPISNQVKILREKVDSYLKAGA